MNFFDLPEYLQYSLIFINLLILIINIYCMITGVIMACSPDPITPPVEAEIELNTSEVSFSSEGGTKSISFHSTLDWKAEISSDGTWCKVTPSSGSGGDATITINAGANSDKSERSTQLTITSGKIKKTISIKQEAKAAEEANILSQSSAYSLSKNQI